MYDGRWTHLGLLWYSALRVSENAHCPLEKTWWKIDHCICTLGGLRLYETAKNYNMKIQIYLFNYYLTIWYLVISKVILHHVHTYIQTFRNLYTINTHIWVTLIIGFLTAGKTNICIITYQLKCKAEVITKKCINCK